MHSVSLLPGRGKGVGGGRGKGVISSPKGRQGGGVSSPRQQCPQNQPPASSAALQEVVGAFRDIATWQGGGCHLLANNAPRTTSRVAETKQSGGGEGGGLDRLARALGISMKW